MALRYGASGPAHCENFVAESIQSVAITQIKGYPNSILTIAAPHEYGFANGVWRQRFCGTADERPRTDRPATTTRTLHSLTHLLRACWFALVAGFRHAWVL